MMFNDRKIADCPTCGMDAMLYEGNDNKFMITCSDENCHTTTEKQSTVTDAVERCEAGDFDEED